MEQGNAKAPRRKDARGRLKSDPGFAQKMGLTPYCKYALNLETTTRRGLTHFLCKAADPVSANWTCGIATSDLSLSDGTSHFGETRMSVERLSRHP